MNPELNKPELSHSNLTIDKNFRTSFIKRLFSSPFNLHRYKIFRDFLSNFGQAACESSTYTKIYPYISENSVNLYHGNETLSFNLYLQKIQHLFLIGGLIFSTSYLNYYMILYGFFYFLYNAWILEPNRRYALRIDYLPHLKKINLQRISFFGCVKNELWDLSDIEHIDYDAVYFQTSFLFML